VAKPPEIALGSSLFLKKAGFEPGSAALFEPFSLGSERNEVERSSFSVNAFLEKGFTQSRNARPSYTMAPLIN
jgi:hypothetical protein